MQHNHLRSLWHCRPYLCQPDRQAHRQRRTTLQWVILEDERISREQSMSAQQAYADLKAKGYGEPAILEFAKAERSWTLRDTDEWKFWSEVINLATPKTIEE